MGVYVYLGGCGWVLVQAACAKVGCRVHIQVLFVRVYELQYVCVGVYIPV